MDMRGIALSILATGFAVGTAIEFAAEREREPSMFLKGETQAFGVAITLAALTCIAMAL
jgi:hypothetical protein